MAKTPTQLRSEAACKNQFLEKILGKDVVLKLFNCSDKPAALDKALELISEDDVVSWGGSVTIQEIGLLDVMRSGRYKVIDRDTAETLRRERS